ncbi:MAG: hypothetical protein PHR94_01785 [Methylomonas lenta]|nr:hypothetical protein [Methylomonas lenta]
MKKILLSLLAIILVIEEWLWDALSAFGHFLISLLHLEEFERWLNQVSPNIALIAFMIPLLIVTPINLAALVLLAHGLILQGILLEILAKLLGTLLVSRVFALTKSQLLTFKILAVIYSTIMRWLMWAHQKVTETKVYKLAKVLKAQAKDVIVTWFN